MKKVLLKISGEAFCAAGEKWIHAEQARAVAQLVSNIADQWYAIAVVCGGGNIYRGSNLIAQWVCSADSHNMSMLSTVFNAMVLQSFLKELWKKVRVLDALGVEFIERYTSLWGKRAMSDGEIVICTSGTGSPYFTTDSGAVVRALELECEAMIKLTKVDGVYSADPMSNPSATKIDEISYDDFVAKNLWVFDQTWIILARDNNLPIYVTSLADEKSIMDILMGEKSGSKITHL